MPLALTETEHQTDLDALLRLQDILLEAVEGGRGPELDQEYRQLRKSLIDDPTYQDVVPTFVRRHRDLGSLWPTLKSFSPQWEPRRVEVRRQFEGALATAEKVELFGKAAHMPPGYDSSAWTGANSASDRIQAVKTLFPVALSAVEVLIAKLEEPRHNGGPLMNETEAALDALRQLHRTLGELLAAADEGKLPEVFNSGLPTEAARYAKRAAKSLRDDPMPYAVSATILAIMTACGMPGIGGFLTSVAISMKKK